MSEIFMTVVMETSGAKHLKQLNATIMIGL